MALHKQVSFMTDTVRAEFINKRKHPDFLKPSNQARDNQLSGQTYRQGSVSTPQVVKKMAKKKDGILPTAAAEVYESTHSVCVGNDEVELMGDTSQKVMEYKNKGIEINPDKVYLDVVGGQKKGKVYGLGSASQMYYKRNPTSQSTASSSTPSMISQLSSQVQELKKMAEENHNKVEESQKIAAESLKYAKEFVENHEIEKATWKKEKLAMEKTLQEMTSLVKQCYRPWGSKPKWIDIKFERLSDSCYYCGLLDHTDKECEKKETEEGPVGAARKLKFASPRSDDSDTSPRQREARLVLVTNEHSQKLVLRPRSVNADSQVEAMIDGANFENVVRGEEAVSVCKGARGGGVITNTEGPSPCDVELNKNVSVGLLVKNKNTNGKKGWKRVERNGDGDSVMGDVNHLNNSSVGSKRGA
uniref:Zinc knuckle CX2CX4HX4C domain-containing protein n=1 Tax=Chenopodium quinoa TaxID=63459 RepID=A0A803MUD9_CHEQI